MNSRESVGANPLSNVSNRGFVVGLPSTTQTDASTVVVQPQLSINLPSEMREDNWMLNRRPSSNLSSTDTPFVFYQEPLPPPSNVPLAAGPEGLPTNESQAIPVFDAIMMNSPTTKGWFHRTSTGEGLGLERMPFGLFDIDPAQPSNNFRVRGAFADRMHLPDRAEYFWARTKDSIGPPNGESVLDYQELRLRMELGSKKFSTTFEVPFRSTAPVINRNHAGLSDLQMIIKTVLLEGEHWMLTQYFGTRFPTGTPSAGLGAGHVGLEPGLLFRNKLHDKRWLHGEIKFWFPLGANPDQGGQVLKFATGLNSVWWETDTAALVPSFEISTFTVLNGQARDATQTLRAIDGDFILNLTPGVHYAVDRKGDFGLFEIGGAMSFATTTQRFADSTFLIDMRWSW